MTIQSVLRSGAFAACSLLVLAGCQTVQKPNNDTTPPVLRWTAINHATNEQIKRDGSGTINAKMGDGFTVILTAEDPQGIHQITMSASTQWSCTQGNIGQGHGPSLGAQQVQNLQPNAQNQVLTSIILIDNANMNFQCQSGFNFSGGSVVFSGSGTNYGNQTVNGALTIKVPG